MLDAEERRDLATRLLEGTLQALAATPGIAETYVVTPDDEVRGLALTAGARPLLQRTSGLNDGLREARDEAVAAGARAVLIVPIDLPAITPDAIRHVLDALADSAGPVVAIVADRHARGTNALLLAPPDVIEPQFGGDSYVAHTTAAARGRRPAGRTRRSAGRGHRHARRPAPRRGARPGVRSWLTGSRPSPSAALARSSRATTCRRSSRTRWPPRPTSLPLRDDDVLVVTQKIVSKAEGAIVDLTTIEPRPEAVAFAEAWDRDPRQVEVVLREARRVVRMANGVIITETEHGFVCANGGVDASNVGPASGSIVTLLPHDPDASAAAIRGAVRARLGHDLPVIVSDSFGRPWRFGIVDVAIGVSGLLPARRPARDARRRRPGHAFHRPSRRR